MIENDGMFQSGNFGEHGLDRSTLPHITYDMLTDDNFMATKMDEMLVGGGA